MSKFQYKQRHLLTLRFEARVCAIRSLRSCLSNLQFGFLPAYQCLFITIGWMYMLTWKSFFLSFFFLELDVILFFQPQSRCMFRSLCGENAVVKSMNATVAPTLKIG